MPAPWTPPKGTTEALLTWMQAHPDVWRAWWPSWGACLDEEEQSRRLRRLLDAGCPGAESHATDPRWQDHRSFKQGGKTLLFETATERFITAADAAVAAARAAHRTALTQRVRALEVPPGHGVFEGVQVGC